MSDYLNIDTLDPQGDIRNAAEDAGAFNESGMDRRSVLRRGAAAGGGLVIAGGIFQTMLSPAEAAISRKKKSGANDLKILNYALTLEYLEAAFYAQGNANSAWLTPEIQHFAMIAGKHEADHVAALKKALGSKAVKSPMVDFKDAVTDKSKFIATAAVLEDTGVSAYAGQSVNVFSKGVLAVAASILSVEARHAAWARFLLGGGAPTAALAAAPAPATFDAAATDTAVLAAVGKTGFIVS